MVVVLNTNHHHFSISNTNRNGKSKMMPNVLPKGKKISKKQEALIRREMAKMIGAIIMSQSTPTKTKRKGKK